MASLGVYVVALEQDVKAQRHRQMKFAIVAVVAETGKTSSPEAKLSTGAVSQISAVGWGSLGNYPALPSMAPG